MTLTVMTFIIMLATVAGGYGVVSLISFYYEAKTADQAVRKTQSSRSNVTSMRNNEQYEE